MAGRAGGSAGTIHIGVAARTEQFSQDMEKAGRIVHAFGDKTERSGQQIARYTQRALLGAAVGLNAVASAATAADRKFLAMGANIAAAFAAGGPVGGAIAAVSTAVGLFVGKIEEARIAEERWHREQEERAKKHAAALARVNDQADRLAAGIRAIQAGVPIEELNVRDEIAALKRILDVRGQIAVMKVRFPELEVGFTAEDMAVEQQARERLAALENLLAKMQEMKEASKEQAAWEEASARWGKEMARNAEIFARARRESTPSLGRIRVPSDRAPESTGQDNWDMFTRGVGAGPKPPKEAVRDFAAESADTLTGTFNAAIVDGIFSGFENAEAIVSGFAQRMASIVTDALFEAIGLKQFFLTGFRAILGGLSGGASALSVSPGGNPGAPLMVAPVAVPASVIGSGIQVSPMLQRTVSTLGRSANSLAEYRGAA